MYLVLLETAANQKYIFTTNKLKENIGASELTYRSGTKWLLEAIGEITASSAITVWGDSQRLRRTLLDPTHNPNNIEVPSSTTRFEIIVAASGKALVLTKQETDAQSLIQQVTHKALDKAPGLEITGLYLPFDWEKDLLGEVNAQLHKQYEKVRSSKPSAAMRFSRLPIVAACQNSGLPAADLQFNPDGGRPIPLSQMSISKQAVSIKGRERVERLLSINKSDYGFAADTNELEAIKQIDWLAIVHADGNGLGQIFQNFHHHIDATSPADNRKFVDKLRRFSIGLDICTEQAFLSALDQLPTYKSNRKDKPELIPLTPLILGGDDLTVVCDGRSALPFTAKFLEAFEAATAASHPEVGSIVSEVAQAALRCDRLSACAGVAIVKLHFPFSVAYSLAEQLMSSAKEVKLEVTHAKTGAPLPCSALDFHIVYDSSDVSFSAIRDKLKTYPDEERETVLYKRPYVVTEPEKLSTARGKEWASFHRWQTLLEAIQVVTAKDEDGRAQLPNSQIHDLRVALYQGQSVADARYRLIRDRYQSANIVTLAGSQDSLFQLEPLRNQQPAAKKQRQMTVLLDALDASEFMGQASSA
ncbi:MAG: hypothetical protein AAFR58_21690 [Cyanobacteria bacterium J06627_28]